MVGYPVLMRDLKMNRDENEVKTEKEEVLPNASGKTYGLMELVKGTSPMVEKGPEDTVMSWPHLLILEVLAALGTTVLLLLWSVAVKAPLREMANPNVTENPAKAAWYFLGIQELLMHFHPFFAVLVFPILVLIALLLLPYYKFESNNSGVWFFSEKGRKSGIISAVAAFIMTPIAIILGEYVIDFEKWFPGFPLFVSNGLLPFLLTIVIIFVYYIYERRTFP